MNIHLVSTLLLSVLLCACNTTKYGLKTLPENTITIGDGGGFAGIETGYLLLENGQIFQYTLPGDTIELKTIRPTKAKELYAQFEQLRLHKLDIEKPGNLYYFIRFTDPEVDHSITWGAASYHLRSDILDFYKTFKSDVKDQKPVGRKVAENTPKQKKKKKQEEEVTGW